MGTIANHTGETYLVCFRSPWVQRAQILPLKYDLIAAPLGSKPVHKLSEVPDEMVVHNMTILHRKALLTIIALLVLVCVREPHFTDILTEMLSSPIAGVMPSRRTGIEGGIVQAGRRKVRRTSSGGPDEADEPD